MVYEFFCLSFFFLLLFTVCKTLLSFLLYKQYPKKKEIGRVFLSILSLSYSTKHLFNNYSNYPLRSIYMTDIETEWNALSN
ncbi:hypothetical protein BDA99DRAFT_243333 [Phascolomyces articulosus]|uniref:Uncharacterized protein n=1 Tax=Phascolomyces articulosus TaxID=60185 RepID=A0AAD5PHS1_9FUNG|nr:hypothetical protein BDA99DRAFT_243333 [Phascolomyces articulosus]